jgi:hypothetical protein
MQAVFAEVFELGMVEDVNHVLFAAPRPLPDQARALDGSAAGAVAAARKLLPLSRAEGDAPGAEVPSNAPLVAQLQRLRLVEEAGEAAERQWMNEQTDVPAT